MRRSISTSSPIDHKEHPRRQQWDQKELSNVKIMEVSYIDQEALEASNTCLFNGTFYDKDKKKVGMGIPPDTFFNSIKMYNVKNYSIK